MDSIIAKVSDNNFDEQVDTYKTEIKQIITGLQAQPQNQQTTANGIQSGSQPISQPVVKAVPLKIQIPPPWKMLLDEISYNYEPIYHSSICEKLKKIAKLL